MVLFSARTLFSLLAFTATIGGTSGQSTGRLDGGEPAIPGRYDFYVYLEQGCAGSLIAPDVIVSAAHCVDVTANNMNVSVGADQPELGEIRTITANALHPLYDSSSMEYDVIVLQLDQPVRNIVPLEINTNSSLPMIWDNLTIIGYATPDPDPIAVERHYEGLLQGTINALPDGLCEDDYGDIWVGNETMLCAGNGFNEIEVFNCPGDTGGPLLDADNKMVGIVSIGTSCGAKQMPGIYTRASAYAEWVQYMACALSREKPHYCPQYNETNGNATNSIAVNMTDDAETTTIQPAPTAGPTPSWDSTAEIVIVVGVDNDETVETVATPTVPPQVLSLRLEINYDAYGIENAWELRNFDVDEILDEKAYYKVAPAGLTSMTYENLPQGNYTFLIQDYANDGICCNFGDGYVRIVQVYDDDVVDVDEKELWYLQGDFESQASVEFELLPYDPVSAMEGDAGATTAP